MIEKYPEWLESIRIKAIEFFQQYSIPRWMVFGLDSFAVFLIFLYAYIVRFNFILSDFNHALSINHAFIAMGIFAIFGLIFRSYSGLIRHTTIIDIFIVFLTTSCSVLTLAGLTLLNRKAWQMEILNIPFSILLIHYVSITLLLFFVRIIIKISFQLISTNGARKNVLIFGAGDMGVVVKRVLNSDIKNSYHISGFLDYSKKLQGKELNGITVYPPKALNHGFLRKHKIKILIIAVENISAKRKSEIIRLAIDLGLEILETPPVNEWLHGKLQIRQIQKVKIKDLLGRDPIQLNLDLIGKGLEQKVVLVTGAAGSIGSEIVRQLARFNMKMAVLVDQAETPMFHLNNELHARFGELHFRLVIADVTNLQKMESIFQEFRPDIVFHAAAYKHVPLMEENPHEAIRVNLGGTKLITELSVKYSVKKFVMISTDKSVNPSSVMGATKRACEILVQSKAQLPKMKTQFVVTRFGNVLGSNGSVVPLFTNQIEEGGPITVTHPEITRYFMTIPEACELVLEAGFIGHGGEIFVFDMGKPIRIVDLANQMIKLSGLIPGKDIQIKFTGLRPGEKLYEELLSNNEKTIPTHHPKIKIAKIEKLENETVKYIFDYFLNNLATLSKQEVVGLLNKIVPEYKSSNEKYNGQKVQNYTVR